MMSIYSAAISKSFVNTIELYNKVRRMHPMVSLVAE